MTRRTRMAAALCAVALISSACGDDKEGGGGSQPTTASLTGQTVEVAAVWSGEEQAKFQKVLDAFAAKTGAKVNYTSTGDDIATVLGTRISGGSPPDVAVLPQPGLLNDLAKKNQLKALPSDVESVVDSNYSSIWKKLGTGPDGKLYGVWVKAADKSTVWYRTDKFQAAGVEAPKTWDDFVKACKTLSDAGTTPLSIGGADGWVLTDWFENVYLRVAGGEKYDQLAKHEIPWTDQTVIDSLNTLKELWTIPNVMVGNNAGVTQVKFTQSVSNVFGASPKAAIVYEGDFVATSITKEGAVKVGEGAKFFNFPSIKDSPESVVGGGDVAVSLKETKGGTELLKWLATPEAAAVWAKQGGFISPNKNLNAAEYPDDTTRQVGEAIVKAGDQFRFDLSDLTPAAFGGTPDKGFWAIMQAFIKNPNNVQGTAQALEAAAKTAYGS